jgi:hypothetical protein
LHSLNLRGRRLPSVVPANGCLATLLMRWSSQLIEDSPRHASFTRRENPSCQVVGNLRFPLTLTYHGCPETLGLLSLNLRGRGFTVPANGCLATLLLRWQCVRSRTVLNRIPQIAGEKPFHQVKGNLRFPLTVTYHGCPETSGFPPSRICPRASPSKLFSCVATHPGGASVRTRN